MNFQQFVFLSILGGALVLFSSKRLRVDVSALLMIVALSITGILTLHEALGGFSGEPAIIVATVFVLSAGLSTTGVTDYIGQAIGRAAGGSEWGAIMLIMPAVAILSAFTNHLMITAMMLPIVMKMARIKRLAPSRLLLPMSLAASLGSLLTVISDPALLLADDLLKHAGHPGLNIFSITPIGIALLGCAMLFMLFGRWLLPRRGDATPEADYLKLDRYYTEIILEDPSPWIGKQLLDLENTFGNRLTVMGWLRGGVSVSKQTESALLCAGDVLLVRASPDEMASIEHTPGIALHAVAKHRESRTADVDASSYEEHQFVQAMVAPKSEFVGRAIGTLEFLRTLGVAVVGLWRKEDWVGVELAHVTLRPGDMLVLWGERQKFAELAMHRGFLMMIPLVATQQQRHRWPVAVGILVSAIALTAAKVMPAQIAFLAGAVAMVLTRCIGIQEAYRAIDTRIYVMIAAVVPLGLAMEKTGMARLFSQTILLFSPGWSSLTILLAIFTVAALMTQVLHSAATTVLLAPVAILLASSLGQPPEPFVVCVVTGAVAAFLTPISHTGNLLILVPGRYKFSDFLRVGFPLTLMFGLISAWLARWLWLQGPFLPLVLR
jgi:di/tricarboxylate transporter